MMSDIPQREMTLEEWVDQLPVDHQARKELAQLEAANATLLEALAEACYLLYIAKEGLTPAWDKQSESTKQIWRDEAIRKASA